MFFQDLKYGLRQLLKAPGFLTVAVLSLALGIGANTAVFSLLNSVLLTSLPVRDPQKLVMLTDPGTIGVMIGSTGGERGIMSYPEFADIRRDGKAFDTLCAVEAEARPAQARIGNGAQEEVVTKLVSGAYFDVLGVRPQLGRFFNEDMDAKLGGTPFAVISDGYWQRRFSRDPQVIGKTITLGRTALTVMGVAGRGFSGETVGQKPDVWAPIAMQLQLKPGRDWIHPLADPTNKAMWLHVYGRLRSELQSLLLLALFPECLPPFHPPAVRVLHLLLKNWINANLGIQTSC